MDGPGEDWHAGIGPKLGHQLSGFKSCFGKPYFVKLLFWNMRLLVFGSFQPTKWQVHMLQLVPLALNVLAALWSAGNSVSMSGGCEAAVPGRAQQPGPRGI